MKPANLILSLLRTYQHQGTSVKNIMDTGAMFGFNQNMMRVNLSRLVTRGLVVNTGRGHYRICEVADPVNQFVENWRAGENRVVPWNDRWLMICLAESADEKCAWVLSSHGFRLLHPYCWVRPDNLHEAFSDLLARLQSAGLPATAVAANEAHLSEDQAQQYFAQFDLPALASTYQRLTAKLEVSIDRLPEMDQEEARRESFALGGEVISTLAKDPLLPETIMPAERRARLWQLMLTYDRLGRSVWSDGQPAGVTAIPISQTEFQSLRG